jgi:hypothetical protein
MYPFVSFSKKKKMLTPSQISEKRGDYFRSIGFDLADARNISNANGQTDLIVAGVQMFDDVIHRRAPIHTEQLFVAQPCVRMQFQPSVGTQEGTSTSFVNVCTEKMGGSFEEHLQAVNHWCTILSKLGLHMNDFFVIMRTATSDWGTGSFSALELFFVYGGLELGDASYFFIPQPDRSAIPISDIGFGLERIAWAVNKTHSYFDMLIPWTAQGTREKFDACRTLSLLLLCNVQASNKGPGLQFRRFAKTLSESYYGEDIFQIISYYFDYWSQFIKPSISRETGMRQVRLEIERFLNLKVSGKLGLPPPREETAEDYFNRLVYTCSVDIQELRKAIQTCKT